VSAELPIRGDRPAPQTAELLYVTRNLADVVVCSGIAPSVIVRISRWFRMVGESLSTSLGTSALSRGVTRTRTGHQACHLRAPLLR
jgi:hypothetical protein